MARLLDRIARKLVPSVPVLSHRRFLMVVVDAVDALISLPFREFRNLPPNRFRIRVGVGNRLFFNQAQFLNYGAQTWNWLFGSGLADNRSDVLEIGCGCGRAAMALANLGFQGHYTGIDVDREMIEWCRSKLGAPNLVFEHADVFSKVYHPEGEREEYRVPVEDASQDLVFSQSLFTHLLEEDLANYVRESARVLKPGRSMAMGVFCLDDMREAGTLGGRWTFQHSRGHSHLESTELPEAAVAYERDFLIGLCRDAGLSEVGIEAASPQSILICRR